MTLKELFLSVDFDRVWPIILNKEPEMTEFVIDFKQVYDEVRLIEIESEVAPKTIKIYTEKEIDYEYITVANSDDHFHRVLAGRQISVNPKLNLSPEELAAQCLWELTYYGFSDEDVSETLEGFLPNRPEECNNKYWIEYHEKRNRWWSRKFIDIVNRSRKRNRSKRKRDYRHHKRLRQLRRYAKIEELQQYLISHKIDFRLWDVLTRCKSFSVATDRSYASVPEDAAQYLCDLYSKYGSAIKDNEEVAFSIIILTGGSKVTTDYTKLYDVLKKTFKYPTVLVGDSNEEQITVKIVSVTAYPLKSKTKNEKISGVSHFGTHDP